MGGGELQRVSLIPSLRFDAIRSKSCWVFSLLATTRGATSTPDKICGNARQLRFTHDAGGVIVRSDYLRTARRRRRTRVCTPAAAAAASPRKGRRSAVVAAGVVATRLQPWQLNEGCRGGRVICLCCCRES